MSIKYEGQIKQINDSKEDIARAIALAVYDGDEKKAEKAEAYFRHVLVNETSAFIYDCDGLYNEYFLKVKDIINEISDKVGRDIYYEATNILINNKKQAVISTIDDDLPKGEAYSIYKQYEKYYSDLGLRYRDIYNLYNDGGIDKVNELNSLIKKYNDKTFMFNFRLEFSMVKELHLLKSLNKKFDNMKKKYNIDTMDDLLTLNNEVSAFLVDESKLDKDSKEIVLENRNNYRKRMNLKDDCMLSQENAKNIIKDIEKIYNFNLYRQMFENTNIKDFIDMNKIEYTESNLNKLFGILFHLKTSGLCHQNNFGKGNKSYCFYRSDILEDYTKFQDDVIVHEFVHALEKRIGKNRRFFRAKYNNINEAITEYISKKAIDNLEKSVLVPTSEKNLTYSNKYTIYEGMLPLVEVLKKSKFWDDFLKAKFLSDVKGLERRVGPINMKLISSYFDRARHTAGDPQKSLEIAKKLESSIKRLEKWGGLTWLK